MSFLSKLTLFAFVLCTVPVVFIGAFSYTLSSNQIQEKVNQSKMQLLMQTSANVELIMKTISHTMNQALSSTVVKQSLNKDMTPKDFMTYNDLRNELQHMQSFDTKLQDVVLVNRRFDWMIKNSGIYRLNQYAYSSQLKKMIDTEGDGAWALLPSYWFLSEENASNPDCNYTISLVKKLPTIGPDKYGMALANLSACSLGQFVQYDLEDFASVMILDDQYRILFHSDPSMIGKSVMSTGFVQYGSLAAPIGQFDATIDGKPYTVNYIRSNYNGWVYLSTVSIDSLTKESDKIGLTTAAVCLLLLLLLLVMAWLGSRRMYSPIQQLMNYLTESNKRLEREVHRHLPQVRTYLLTQAFQGQVRPSVVREKLVQYGYGPQMERWRTMSVLTIQIDTLEGTRYGKNDLDLLLFAAQNIVEESIPEAERLHPVLMEQAIVILVGSPDVDPDVFDPFLYAMTERLQQQIQMYLNLPVSIGLSLPFRDLANVPAAYREGLEALRLRIALGQGIIIRYENLNEGKPYLSLSYPYQHENDLIDAIKLAETDKARESLRQFMAAAIQTDLHPRDFQIPLARLLNSLLTVMQESGVGQRSFQRPYGSFYEELFRLPIASEIEDWFWQRIIQPMIVVFQNRQNSQYQNISEKVIDLIQREYDTDLTLEACASRLHFNANYLSSVFRKETNHSFSEYLTSYRFSMAKRWLKDTDMPIKDIAEKLRYNNPQNFIRSFRKVEGMTPGQYRSKYVDLNG